MIEKFVGKREAQAEETRKAILGAAEALFVARGFAATSMSEIASRAKVTKSLIHHHFGSKQELWREIIKRTIPPTQIFVEGLIEKSGCEWGLSFFEKAVDEYFQHTRDNNTLFRLAAWLKAEREGGKLSVPFAKKTVDCVRKAQENGKVRNDYPAEILLSLFLNLIESWDSSKQLINSRLGVDVDNAESDRLYLKGAKKMLLAFLAPPEK